MQHFSTLFKLQEQVFQYRKNDNTIAFVPTMGALHEGHISLVRLAKQHAERVIVSIFVNPSQFTNPQDLEYYPRDIAADVALLTKENVEILFTPMQAEIYPKQGEYLKTEDILLPEQFSVEEGATRSGHFEGVYQVLHRFFSIIQPDSVVFGQKDFQQTLLVRYLIEKEFPEIQFVLGEIFREPSGLAMSSRNARLSQQGKKDALVLSQVVRQVQEKFSQGHTTTKDLITLAEESIKKNTAVEKISSLNIRNGKTFRQKENAKKGDIFLLALTISGVHLLDNGVLE